MTLTNRDYGRLRCRYCPWECPTFTRHRGQRRRANFYRLLCHIDSSHPTESDAVDAAIIASHDELNEIEAREWALLEVAR